MMDDDTVFVWLVSMLTGAVGMYVPGVVGPILICLAFPLICQLVAELSLHVEDTGLDT